MYLIIVQYERDDLYCAEDEDSRSISMIANGGIEQQGGAVTAIFILLSNVYLKLSSGGLSNLHQHLYR